MKSEEFNELKNILEEELTFDPTSYKDMQQKLSKIPNLLQTYLTIYINQKEILNDLETRLKETYASLYHKYKYPTKGDGLEFEYNLETKNEINLYVEGNEDYIKKSLIVEKQRIQVEYLEKTLQNIRDMLWSLKYTIDQRKFFEGIS